MAFSDKLFYIEQQEGDWAGFLTGEGLMLHSGTFLVVRYAAEPGFRPVQTWVYLSYQDLVEFLHGGEKIIWYGGHLDPVQDQIRRQLKRIRKQ
jgi:hypothetical protein